ncbi:probable beta-hexosaminidase fdl isoform X1 [Diorhabda carinulata]|uniref:probable beta-hexosaminidase fdl isoform X1 n=1 Tax=Diorhabda carinulata TaxID=1163345 RepID=UPI0025A2D6DE|nr:probable beta-hexosaminidase fdl isoform X1 [Diorhabda carinulata]
MNSNIEVTAKILDSIEDSCFLDINHTQTKTTKCNNLVNIGILLMIIIIVFGYQYLSYENEIQQFTFGIIPQASDSTISTYGCINNVCNLKVLKQNETQVNLESCKRDCLYSNLWPIPTTVGITNLSESSFRKNHITLSVTSPNNVKKDINRAFDTFMNYLPSSSRSDINLTDILIKINVSSEELRPTLQTDESYYISIEKNNKSVIVNIVSESYFGARHALETLSQLIWFDETSQNLQIYHGVEIKDKPAFPHRGLMVDTSRNFFPINKLLKVIDGMAANKLNVFHLHLTDSVSFPIVLPSNPWLAKYGAYSQKKTYTPDDIKGLIEYARIRGIRVILEIDSPSHVNEGWNQANTDTSKIIICGDEDVTNGHLNPDNPRTFQLLKSIYADLIQLGTDRETFHIGGDEVNLDCYEKTEAAGKFEDVYDFWVDLNHKIFEVVGEAFRNETPKNLVIWSNDLTSYRLQNLKYSNNLVIQYWYGRLDPIIKNGNQIIFSTVGHWYLDCGFGPWKPSEDTGSCGPYTHWKVFYNYRPWENYPSNKKQFLGGETCLWSEQVDVDSLETRIWPRTAAFAERVWSDLPFFDPHNVVTRLSAQRDRLIRRNLQVAAIWPEWCTHHPGKC